MVVTHREGLGEGQAHLCGRAQESRGATAVGIRHLEWQTSLLELLAFRRTSPARGVCTIRKGGKSRPFFLLSLAAVAVAALKLLDASPLWTVEAEDAAPSAGASRSSSAAAVVEVAAASDPITGAALMPSAILAMAASAAASAAAVSAPAPSGSAEVSMRARLLRSASIFLPSCKLSRSWAARGGGWGSGEEGGRGVRGILEEGVDGRLEEEALAVDAHAVCVRDHVELLHPEHRWAWVAFPLYVRAVALNHVARHHHIEHIVDAPADVALVAEHSLQIYESDEPAAVRRGWKDAARASNDWHSSFEKLRMTSKATSSYVVRFFSATTAETYGVMLRMHRSSTRSFCADMAPAHARIDAPRRVGGSHAMRWVPEPDGIVIAARHVAIRASTWQRSSAPGLARRSLRRRARADAGEDEHGEGREQPGELPEDGPRTPRRRQAQLWRRLPRRAPRTILSVRACSAVTSARRACRCARVPRRVHEHRDGTD